MKITLKNFNKYNPRKDLKSMPWCRLENNFYDLEDFYDLDVYARWLFVFLLCQCGQKVSATINIDKKYMIFKSKLTENQLNAALSSLLNKSVILLDTNEYEHTRSDSCLTNERTNERNEQNERVRELDFNIDAIYKIYPKKEGGKKGLEKLQKIIKTQDDYDKVLQGVKKYKEFCESTDRPKKFIKQFSTWVNNECWNDEYEVELTPEQELAELEKQFLEKRGLDVCE